MNNMPILGFVLRVLLKIIIYAVAGAGIMALLGFLIVLGFSLAGQGAAFELDSALQTAAEYAIFGGLGGAMLGLLTGLLTESQT